MEEVAIDQGRRACPVALFDQPHEFVGVQLHRAVYELNDVARGRDVVVPHELAQHADGLAHGSAGGGVVLVRPEQTDQLLAGAAVFGGAREIQQQRDVLLPQQLGGRRRAVHCDFERAQRLQANHRVAQLSARARTRAVSARAPKGAGASDQWRTTAA